MFGRKKSVEFVKIDEVLERILLEMAKHDPSSREYSAMLGHFERVITLRRKDERKRIDYNTVLLVAGNLLGILVIVAYEQKHVFTSKGLGFIPKFRAPD